MTIDEIRKLNKLLAILSRSFVQYLRWSRPYAPAGHEEALETLAAIADDQDAMGDRISRTVIDAGALPRTGEFPMEFTDLHDLDLDFLIAAAVRYQEYDVTAVQALVEGLSGAPAAKSLAEESLGLCKGHLDSLRELVRAPVISV